MTAYSTAQWLQILQVTSQEIHSIPSHTLSTHRAIWKSVVKVVPDRHESNIVHSITMRTLFMLEGSNAGRIIGGQTVANQMTAILHSNASRSFGCG